MDAALYLCVMSASVDDYKSFYNQKLNTISFYVIPTASLANNCYFSWALIISYVKFIEFIKIR